MRRFIGAAAAAALLVLGTGGFAAATSAEPAGSPRDHVTVDDCTPGGDQPAARGRVMNPTDADRVFDVQIFYITGEGTVVARSSVTVSVAAGETEPWRSAAEPVEQGSPTAIQCVVGAATSEVAPLAGSGSDAGSVAAAWTAWRWPAAGVLALVAVGAVLRAVSLYRAPTAPEAPAVAEVRRRLRRRDRRRRRLLVVRPVAVAVVALAAAGLAVGTAGLSAGATREVGSATGATTGTQSVTPPSVVTLPDMDGNAVVADPGSVPTGAEVDQMDLVDDAGVRIRIPEVGLDAPLGEVNEVDNMIRPPGFTAAYRVRNRGVGLDDAAQGTVYVAMHSVRGGRAPGNALIDVEAGAPTVAAGDTVRIGDLVYRVESAELIAKTELPSVDSLWTDEPGRLVIVTCLQRTEGRSLQNLVVVATLEG